LDSILDVIVIN